MYYYVQYIIMFLLLLLVCVCIYLDGKILTQDD